MLFRALYLLEKKIKLEKKSIYNIHVGMSKRKMDSVGLWWDFRKAPDLVLVVEDEEYHVHKEILTEASPVFKVMLESENFLEKHSRRILLPGKREADIQQLLNFLYPYGHNISGIPL